jgi:hypothetical protein
MVTYQADIGSPSPVGVIITCAIGVYRHFQQFLGPSWS